MRKITLLVALISFSMTCFGQRSQAKSKAKAPASCACCAEMKDSSSGMPGCCGAKTAAFSKEQVQDLLSKQNGDLQLSDAQITKLADVLAAPAAPAASASSGCCGGMSASKMGGCCGGSHEHSH